MISNYFKIAWRNLMKYKFISLINLLGLTIGLTCCLLITTYIVNELSYDRYNKNVENIYRVTRSFNNSEGIVSLNLSTVSPPFGYYFPSDFPEIKKMTRLLNNGTTPLKYKDKLFNEEAYFADENLFDVFTLDMVRGNPKTALQEPFSVVLSEEVAKRYFGDEDPMNKVLKANNQFDIKVTGIYKGFPANSHMHPGMLVSFNTLKDPAVYGEENLRKNWGNNSFFTYLLLPEHYDPNRMIARFPAFVDRRMDHKDYNGNLPSKFTKLGLQRLSDIHLKSHTDYEAEPNGDINRVYIFSIIALFILIIACINYMNLSTARSALRAREIGIRKVIGARRKEIIFQFLSESILISCTAIIFSFAILYLTLPWLNKISGQVLTIKLLMNWQIFIPVLITPFVVGIFAGLYPALFMSSFQPVKTLKGLFKAGGGNISLRKVLVVAQFTISIALIITTVIVFQQLRYMQETALGYNKEHLVTLPYYNDLNASFETFRNELLQNPQIRNAARSSRIPTGRLLDAMGASTLVGDSMRPVTADIKFVVTDFDFIPTYGIPVVAGRNFNRSYGTDTSNFILNEAAVSAIGWKSSGEAVGKNFKYGQYNGKIIGVVGDFHFESLKQKIVPIVLMNPAVRSNQSFFNNLSIKISGKNISSELATIEKAWRKWLPEIPYQYSFLDERFASLYESEQRQGTIFTVFACIAIFIASLGLFGLSAFAITQRIKEIGIRKVLGARVDTIVKLLSGDFLKLVLIAAVIAFPLAWYAMSQWLQEFAYRIPIHWWVFVLSALVAMLVALTTVCFHAIKAAIANPVKSLRSE
jgi:putative ABC transport system permease protein